MTGLAIIGAGSWGTALAVVLAPGFQRVRLWAYDAGLAPQIQRTRENSVYLPGFILPPNVAATDSLNEACLDVDCILLVVPSQHLRSVFRLLMNNVDGRQILVSAAKGIEKGSLLRVSQVIEEESRERFAARVAVLSGPTFAREVAAGEPAAVVVASSDGDVATAVQSAFSGPTLRLYTNDDVAGVEIAAALKNVIAIAAGVVQGLGLGNNTLAALITRGLAEITRLAAAMGGREKTLAGLAGLGDLVLTCTGDLSRNRRVGIELAHGRRLAEVLASTKMVAEGVETTWAALELARRYGVEMPITEQMAAILRDGKSPRDGVRDLMERSLRSE